MSAAARRQAITRGREALRTLSTTAPDAIRDQVLAVVRDVAGADDAVYFRYALVDGERYYAMMRSTAPSTNILYRAFEGQRQLRGLHDHLRPQPVEVSRFVGQTFLRNLPHAEGSALARAYESLHIRDEQRALVYDGPRFIGRVSVHHAEPRRFDADTTTDLNHIADEVRAALVAADRLERADLDAPLQLVVDAEGRIELASSTNHPWLTVERRSTIAAIVARADRHARFDSAFVIDGARMTMVRLYGQSVRYLITFEALTAPELSPDALLSPRQREVADYACAGATAREIGQTLGLSTETVREHLKEIYRRLGIASRVELVNMLRGSVTGGPHTPRSNP